MACEELYEFEFEEDQLETSQFVVNGIITDSNAPYLIRVQSTPSQSVNSVVPKAINNALVYVISEDSVWEQCMNTANGFYRCSEDKFKREPGKAYSVRIEIQDGPVLTSAFDTIPATNVPDFSIEWEEASIIETSSIGIDRRVDVVYINMDVTIPERGDLRFYWHVEEVYQWHQNLSFYFGSDPPPCYIIDDIGSNEIRILNNRDFNGPLDYDHLITREIDESFRAKHIIAVHQEMISQAYYDYLENIEVLVELYGSLFDPPPGIARGNLVSDDGTPVNGFFRAVRADTAMVAIYPSQLETNRRGSICDRCIGCPPIGRYSDFIRPGYYDQAN